MASLFCSSCACASASGLPRVPILSRAELCDEAPFWEEEAMADVLWVAARKDDVCPDLKSSP